MRRARPTNSVLQYLTADCYPADTEWVGQLNDEDAKPEKPFNLEERTARFGEAIIRFCKRIPRGPGNDRIIDQLVGAGTSVGANYCEADDAVSKKEFRCKIGTCKKEARESKFFLRMAATAEPSLRDDATVLWREGNELHKIFCRIFRTCNKES